ncbi:MAG: sugar phosphate isomerase/epimerase [Candidatus Marinimicrobia bacterium]|nr:sugar phosphate isomerase/epimerase [Candidatus Neomarinimicrobiota bacterium]MDP6835703.1 sugar phosphate isomerase/epimerase [Candidatus Neomarinimicrobiota bacterium]
MSYCISRREFVKLLAATGMVLPFNPFAYRLTADLRYSDNLGVQLYTIRDLLKDNPAAILNAVAQIGFKHVELHDNTILNQLVPMLREVGLKITSTHITPALVTGNWEMLERSGISPQTKDVDSVISEVRKHDVEYVVFSWIHPDERGGLDSYLKLAEQLNVAGEKCNASEIKLCYHTHSFEFEPMDNSTPFRILESETDPDLVYFEFDSFWISIAGLDPVEFLQKHGSRCQLMHLKDLKRGIPVAYDSPETNDAFEEVGDGVVNFPELLKTAKGFDISYCYVEQDHTPHSPIVSLRQSFQYLHNLNL